MSDNQRQNDLNEGWRAEMDKQAGRPPRNPQDDDNCAPKAAKVLFLIFVLSQQLYQILT